MCALPARFPTPVNPYLRLTRCMPILERELNHERDGTVSFSRSRSVITGGVLSSLSFDFFFQIM